MAKLWTPRDCNGEYLRKGDIVQAAPGIRNGWWVSGMTLGVVADLSGNNFCRIDIRETTSNAQNVIGLHMAPSRLLVKINNDIEVRPSETLLNMSFMY